MHIRKLLIILIFLLFNSQSYAHYFSESFSKWNIMGSDIIANFSILELEATRVLQVKEYEKILADAKKEVIKIQMESKNILDKDIQSKKEAMEKEIENEISKAQKEIDELKRSSLNDIQNISENITSSIIENISGDKLNESSVKAAVEDVSKKNVGKYL